MNIDRLVDHLDNSKHFFNCSEKEYLDIDEISFLNKNDEKLLMRLN